MGLYELAVRVAELGRVATWMAMVLAVVVAVKCAARQSMLSSPVALRAKQSELAILAGEQAGARWNFAGLRRIERFALGARREQSKG